MVPCTLRGRVGNMELAGGRVEADIIKCRTVLNVFFLGSRFGHIWSRSRAVTLDMKTALFPHCSSILLRLNLARDHARRAAISRKRAVISPTLKPVQPIGENTPQNHVSTNVIGAALSKATLHSPGGTWKPSF